MRSFLRTLLAGALLLGCGAPALGHGHGPFAQERMQGSPDAGAPTRGAPSREAIERWKSLSPEEQARLRERFEAWKNMDETQRAELRRRHERLCEAERTVRRDLPPEARRCLEGLGTHERRELLREHVEQEWHERGRRMRGLLPPQLQERLETASPEERAALIQDLRQRFEQDGLRQGLREVGQELGLTIDEVERLVALPTEVMRAKLLQLRRLEILRRVAREGLPEWISPEQWAEWQGLSDERFLERLHAARPRPGTGEGVPEGVRELWRLMRPDWGWFEELSALSPEQRRDELERRLAQRLLTRLSEQPEPFSAEEVAELRSLAPPEMLERLRERLRAEGGGRREGWGRERRGGREGRGPGPWRGGERRDPSDGR